MPKLSKSGTSQIRDPENGSTLDIKNDFLVNAFFGPDEETPDTHKVCQCGKVLLILNASLTLTFRSLLENYAQGRKRIYSSAQSHQRR